MKCSKCGYEADKVNNFCPYCGNHLNINDFSKKVVSIMSNDFSLFGVRLSDVDIILLSCNSLLVF